MFKLGTCTHRLQNAVIMTFSAVGKLLLDEERDRLVDIRWAIFTYRRCPSHRGWTWSGYNLGVLGLLPGRLVQSVAQEKSRSKTQRSSRRFQELKRLCRGVSAELGYVIGSTTPYNMSLRSFWHLPTAHLCC
jgi:hypothetical protein